MHDALASLTAEFDRWAEQGDTARLWIRDDDAIAATDVLDLFIAVAARHGAPVLLAAIPARLDASLAAFVADTGGISVAVHGWSHANHAPAGAKASEFPEAREHRVMLGELEQGLAIVTGTFSDAALPVFVPPWNRIGATIAGDLAALGYRGLSTFADAHAAGVAGIALANTHVDIMQWRGVRGGRPLADVGRDLAGAFAASRTAGKTPVGLLTHHLVHDAAAKATLAGLLPLVSSHPGATWIGASEVFGFAS